MNDYHLREIRVVVSITEPVQAEIKTTINVIDCVTVPSIQQAAEAALSEAYGYFSDAIRCVKLSEASEDNLSMVFVELQYHHIEDTDYCDTISFELGCNEGIDEGKYMEAMAIARNRVLYGFGKLIAKFLTH